MDVASRPYRIGVLSDDLPGLDAGVLHETVDAMRDAGFDVVRLPARHLESGTALDPARLDALMLTSSRTFPAAAVEDLDRFLREGGDMILLGGRGFERLVKRDGGRWLTFEDMKRSLGRGEGLTALDAFDPPNAKRWRRQANNRAAGSRVLAVRALSRPGLRLDIEGVEHFDTFAVTLNRRITEGHNTIVLLARALSEATAQAAFEMRTRTGARWIATVDLGTVWRPIVLRPGDFAYYQGGPANIEPVLEFSEVEQISFGLARDFGRFEGGDHTIDFTIMGTAGLDVASGHALDKLDLYTDLPPFQYVDAPTAFTAPEASRWLDAPTTFAGPITGTAAFAVPRAGQSQSFPVLHTTNAKGHPVTAGAVVAHYAGPFEGSQWLVVGVESDGLYRQAPWHDLLAQVVGRMVSEAWVDDARAGDAFADVGRMRSIIGVTHAGAKYHHSDRDVLNEGAMQLEALKMRTIKLWMPRPHQMYRFNHNWPDDSELDSLTQVARTPAWREVLDRPFDTYYLEAFSLPRDSISFKDGLTPAERRIITDQFDELTRHLLTTYRGTGKTFVLQNWEGDWALRPAMDPSIDPTPQRIEAMIDWLNARQAGVDRARATVGEDGVRVLHAAETNLVLQQMRDDRPGVVRDVLPNTRIDLVSYSAYDTRGHPHAFRAALEYMAMHLPPTDRTDLGPRVVVGEFGVPETQMGLDAVKRMLPEQVEIATAYGCEHLLYWALYCNEPRGDPPIPVTRNDQVNGFWLIKPDGSRAWAWHYFKTLLDP